jgi:hypothetical protein
MPWAIIAATFAWWTIAITATAAAITAVATIVTATTRWTITASLITQIASHSLPSRNAERSALRNAPTF